jgi:hypothetical protein
MRTPTFRDLFILAGTFFFALSLLSLIPGASQAQTLSVSVDLKANGRDGPILVIQDGTVQLSWSAVNAANCTLSVGGGGGSSGSVTLRVSQRTTFSISCQGSGGTAVDSVIVNVQDKPQPTFSVTPGSGSVGRGGITSFSALFDPDGAGPDIQKDVTQAANWQSDNATVAAIASPGQVRGVAVGATVIHATYGGLIAQASIQVNLVGSRPIVRTLAPKSISQTKLVIAGRVNPNGLATTAWVEYGLGGLSLPTPSKAVGSGSQTVDVEFEIAIPVEGDYSYRVVAKNELGTTRGATLSTRSAGHPGLTLTPSSLTVKSGDTPSFRATYDPDGNGPEPSIDVTTEAHWLVSNPAVAVREGVGTFRAAAPGSAKVTAIYNPFEPIVYDYDITNLTADAQLTVEGSAGGENVALTGPAEGEYAGASSSPAAGTSGSTWIILGGLVVVLVVLGAGGIFLVRRLHG